MILVIPFSNTFGDCCHKHFILSSGQVNWLKLNIIQACMHSNKINIQMQAADENGMVNDLEQVENWLCSAGDSG